MPVWAAPEPDAHERNVAQLQVDVKPGDRQVDDGHLGLQSAGLRTAKIASRRRRWLGNVLALDQLDIPVANEATPIDLGCKVAVAQRQRIACSTAVTIIGQRPSALQPRVDIV